MMPFKTMSLVWFLAKIYFGISFVFLVYLMYQNNLGHGPTTAASDLTSLITHALAWPKDFYLVIKQYYVK